MGFLDGFNEARAKPNGGKSKGLLDQPPPKPKPVPKSAPDPQRTLPLDAADMSEFQALVRMLDAKAKKAEDRFEALVVAIRSKFGKQLDSDIEKIRRTM